MIAKNLGVSAGNDFALLDRIGGECAGAVTFLRRGQEPLEQKEEYRTLSAGELAEILRALPRRPLMAGDEGVRLSLAGAQEKLAIHRSPQGISIPLGGAPSTHILKPAIERFEGLVHNEAFCMRLARVIGLTVAPVEVGNIEGIDYLLVERYDRHWKSDGEPMGQKLKRIHQEDFCQALGIVPERKYQNEGGPSLKESFALLRECSSSPVLDLNALLDAVIFNALIGNHDAHGKNFSLIYSGGKTRMAPLYDLLCTTFYPELSTKMAMKVGGEYDSRKLTGANWERMAEESGLNKLMVKRRVLEMAEQIALHVVVRDQLMPVLQGSLDNGRALQRQLGIHSATGRNADLVEGIEQPPDPDALTVFAPREIGEVGDIARQCIGQDRRTTRIISLGCRFQQVPVLEIDGDDQRQPLAAGPVEASARWQG